MSRAHSTAHGFCGSHHLPHSGPAEYCTPFCTHRACSTVHGSCGSHHLPHSSPAEYCTPFCTHRACSTVHGSCGSHHLPRGDLAGYLTPFHDLLVCSTTPTVGRYCKPIHLPVRGPRASVDAPARRPRGLHRAPPSSPYENPPPTCDLVRPRFERPLDTAPP